MTISIVSSLAASALMAGSSSAQADDAATAAVVDGTTDFAKLLLALPTDKIRSLPLPEGAALKEDATTQPAAEAPAAELMASLGLTVIPPNVRTALDNPPARAAVDNPLGLAALSDGAPNNRAPSLASPSLQPFAADPAGLVERTAGEATASDRQAMLQPTLFSDPQAAKLAAFGIAGATAEPSRPTLSEAASSPVLTTLPLPTGTNPYAPLAAEHPRHELTTPLGHTAWADEFAQKLVWFAGNDRQQAQLTLNPPQLGQVEITLNIDKDVTSAHFASANAEVRNAIESSLPRLREMLAGAGVELGQVTVGNGSDRQPPAAQDDASQSPRQRADNAILGIASGAGQPVHTLTMQRGNALVDLFV